MEYYHYPRSLLYSLILRIVKRDLGLIGIDYFNILDFNTINKVNRVNKAGISYPIINTLINYSNY